MKKTVFCLVTAIMAMTSTNAQETDKRLFNRVSIGLGIGTPGIGVDVAVPCTRFLEFEAGAHFMPKFKYDTNIHTNLSSYKDATNTIRNLNLDEIPIQGKLNMVNGKFMVNFYPAKRSSFHITVGAFFGKGNLVDVYNTQDGQLNAINKANAQIEKYNNNIAKPNNLPEQKMIGLKLDDYLLTPDVNGNVKATLQTNGFKPYVGIGFGRAIAKNTDVKWKPKVTVKFDMGAMFWGAPDIVDHNNHSIAKELDGNGDGGAIRIIKKIKVYPVLNIRIGLGSRIF